MQRLRVSSDKRYLVYEDGTPFFYLGDTAWELFHRLSKGDAARYLRDRAEKGFTVIQAVVLSELEGLTIPNALGDLPLINNDPERPNNAYFEHVDYIVNQAEELGLFIGMLPTWGKYWSHSEANIFSEKNAYTYGRFLGERYRNKPVIWILGGDRNVSNHSDSAIIEAMAEGLKTGDKGNHLITFHPMGPGQSSTQFHNAHWLDFNMSQSSHAAHDHDNGLFVTRDYNLVPTKPTLDGEPRYETIPVGFYFSNANPCDCFTDYDVRQAAYWALLAGACGHTYGHNSVWQMWDPTKTPVLSANVPWYEAMNHPGAFQMGLVRRLFESRPFQRLRPAQDMIVGGPEKGGAKIRAALACDSSFAFVYSPMGESFTVDTTKIKSSSMKVIWFDPRYGRSYHFHTSTCHSYQTYTPPTSGRGNDWLLILENADAGFRFPV